ncbi:hypothetical protein OSTOST_11288, partial [Ostertagia ostertagi]
DRGGRPTARQPVEDQRAQRDRRQRDQDLPEGERETHARPVRALHDEGADGPAEAGQQAPEQAERRGGVALEVGDHQRRDGACADHDGCQQSPGELLAEHHEAQQRDPQRHRVGQHRGMAGRDVKDGERGRDVPDAEVHGRGEDQGRPLALRHGEALAPHQQDRRQHDHRRRQDQGAEREHRQLVQRDPEQRPVAALAAEEGVLAADLGVEVDDQPVDLLHRAPGLGLDGAQVAMILVDGAADPVGRAHVLEQVARHRRLGGHLAGQRVQRADADRQGVELALRGVPLVHEIGIARRRAGLQARIDAAHQARIGPRVAGQLTAGGVELRLLRGDAVAERGLVAAQLFDALANRQRASLGDGGVGVRRRRAAGGRKDVCLIATA